MQPKTEVQFAVGVTEIVKTFISHPDHGLKPEDVPTMIKDIMQAFQGAVSGEAIAAASPAQTTETTTTESASAAVEESAVSAEAPAESAPVAEAPAKTGRGRGRKRNAAPAAEATDTEAVADATADASAEKAPSKKKEKADPLEAKFGGKISRTPLNGMDPEEAIKNEAIICLIDGEPRKMLHRHIRAKYNMEPEEYREWFGLRQDYPMTAPGYSQEKSAYAKHVGLGTKPKTEDPKATPKTSRRSRKNAGEGTRTRQRTTA
jgi:Predicted transcriptional regulator